jgi:RHH-type rel operon transcriptional repressor/antitoxin RelB
MPWPRPQDGSRKPTWQEAIVEYLGNLEDFYLAERRLGDIQAGRTDTVSLAEVERDD